MTCIYVYTVLAIEKKLDVLSRHMQVRWCMYEHDYTRKFRLACRHVTCNNDYAIGLY